MRKMVSRRTQRAAISTIGLFLSTCLGFVFGFVLFIPSIEAQISTTATISGTVTDPSGAIVPGALVTVTRETTTVQTTRQSNDSGEFVIPGLPVGSYTVTVSKQGFSTFTEKGIILHPATTATVAVEMKTGAVNAQVTVTATAAEVETRTPEVSHSVAGEQIKILPLNGRNYQALAGTMPGVLNENVGAALGTGGRATSNVLSVSGQTVQSTLYVLDGIWNENTGNMGQSSVVPNPDSLEEVRVLQNNYSVKYSLMGGSVVLLQTRSGTQKFHGNVWEYLRNTDLNAKNYFSTTRPVYQQNIFGYNLSGPLFIPHLYNADRRKTFFFWNQQWVRLNQGSTLTGITPTADQRAGIFTTSIKDPSTGKPFPLNSSGQYQIPHAELNPDAVAFINGVYPLPNYSSSSNNYINNIPQVTNQRDDEIKVEHNLNQKFRLLGEFLDETQTYTQSSLSGAQSGEIFPTNYEQDLTHNKLAQISLTALLSNALVNTTSVAMNIFDLDLNLKGITDISQVPGFSGNLPFNGYLASRLPLVTISGGTAPEGIPAARPLTHAADLDDTVSDDLSWLKGKQYLQMGINILFNTKRQNVTGPTNGQWSFSGNFTGNGLADFLLGDATSFTQASDQRRVSVHATTVSPYFEDSIHLTKDVTVTAGLRVWHMPLPYPVPGTQTIFDPAAYSLAAAPSVSSTGVITPTPTYNPLNGLVTNGVGGVPNNFSSRHNWYFGPSVGFAWDVFGNGKTSLRGGYGLTYSRIFTNQDCSFNCANNPPAILSSNLVNPIFPNAATSGTTPPPTIQSLSNADLDIQASQLHTYSLGVQREIARNWTASVIGASSQTRHLVGTWNYNQPLPYGNYDFNPVINAGKVSQYLYGPYLGYAGISTLTSRQGSNWNALEASLMHPVSANLFLTVAYTWSHDLTTYTNASYTVIDPYHPSRYYGNAEGLNFPQNASVTAIWNLPWFRQAHGFKRLVLGGWQYSDITTFRSGVSATAGLSVANQGIAVHPDATGKPIKGPQTVSQWFNTAAYQAPQPGYYGNASIGTIRDPGLVDFDMALYKNFHVWESHEFQFRAEAFNVFNHPNFANVVTTVGNSNYGHVTSAHDPRILEFAARYQF